LSEKCCQHVQIIAVFFFGKRANFSMLKAPARTQRRLLLIISLERTCLSAHVF